jgi:hypothetical protein
MLKSSGSAKYLELVASASMFGWMVLAASTAWGGPYLDSAHGNYGDGISGYGVSRSSTGNYSTGNCAHCHEQHASIQGVEPDPADGAAPHALFAENFNTGRTQNIYLESDNFCFYCHSGNSGQQVDNRDYSEVFGGADALSGPQSILDAFNQASYHNLYDIWNFLSNDPSYSSWFAKRGNPCSACHDPHLAKRNWDSSQTGFPLLSAITKPAAAALWGETEVMSNYLAGYEAPYSLGTDREPAGEGAPNGSNTPDYAGFCTTCHDYDNIIASTSLGRDIRPINWDDASYDSVTLHDKHGTAPRDGADNLRDPYSLAGNTNFVLSCLDCHESHGSENTMMLRRRINGEDLEGVVTEVSTETKSYVCKRCHPDDLAAGEGSNPDTWEYVHHLVADAPYAQNGCNDCHSPGTKHIDCGNCHSHGMDDSWISDPTLRSGRKTF